MSDTEEPEVPVTEPTPEVNDHGQKLADGEITAQDWLATEQARLAEIAARQTPIPKGPNNR